MNRKETILQLRNETGVGVMQCSQILEQSGQDFEQALALLREIAASKVIKQNGRDAQEGKIELYAHNNGHIGVMVEINTETEFASRSAPFLDFAHEIALQIAASTPLYVSEADIPPPVLDELVSETTSKARLAGKPQTVIDKIVNGMVEKYKKEKVLLNQGYIRNEDLTIAQLLQQKIAQTGENIIIRRFERWEIAPDSEINATS
jgi:elongation factor Ts